MDSVKHDVICGGDNLIERQINSLSEYVKVVCEKQKELIDNGGDKKEVLLFRGQSNKKYDLIVSTLCDPFLTKKYIEILTKLISKKGIILLTFPTDTFAKKTRKGIENLKYTTFHDRNRNEHKSYSFCWNYIEMINVLKDYGFEIICVYNYHLNEYKKLFNSELLNSMINEDYIVLSGFVIKRKSL